MLKYRRLHSEDLGAVLALQDACFKGMQQTEWLRKNTPETFSLCLKEPNYSLGIFDGEKLAGIGILQICGSDPENLGYSIDYPDVLEVGNMKLVIVAADYRGQHLQYELMSRCEAYAKQHGLKVLACSAHPDNVYSVNNILKSGYHFVKQSVKYGGLTRNIYMKEIG